MTNYPGGLFLSQLGVDPTWLTNDIIVLVCEYAGVCILAVAALWVRMEVIKRGWA